MKIYKYSVSKGSNEGGTTYVSNSSVSSSTTSLVETHYLWGQPFNGTQDVSGDIDNVDDINSSGNITATVQKDSEGFRGGNIKSVGGDIIAEQYTEDGSTVGGNVKGVKGEFEDVSANDANITGTLTAENANIAKAIINSLSSKDAIIKNLTVTGLAKFYELIVDKIKAAGGAILLTPADGFKCYGVVNSGDGYILYWKATDGDTKISNMWKVGDQAICQTFNAAEGTSYNVSNKYYWALVTQVGTESSTDGDLHYIKLSNTEYDGVLNPTAGDEIAMLGYRGTDDESRQSAIYISAYSSIDDTLEAPLFCHYKGVNDFDLSSHKYSWFAANGNEIQGNLLIESGEDVEGLLTDIKSSVSTNTSNISSLNVTANQISATVAEHTTSINTLNGQVEQNTTNISSLTIKADSIESSVKQLDCTEYITPNWFTAKNASNGVTYLYDKNVYTFNSGINSGFQIWAQHSKNVHLPVGDYIASFDVQLLQGSSSNLICAVEHYRDELKKQFVNQSQVRNVLKYKKVTIKFKCVEGVEWHNFTVLLNPSDNQILPVVFTISNLSITRDNTIASLIRQTADEINLQVQDVSLKIDNKQIVLDGNTVVNGSLTLDNSDQGFILKGDDGITYIQPRSVGEYADFASQANSVVPFDYPVNDVIYYDSVTQLENGDYYYTYKQTYVINKSLGQLPTGSFIKISDQTQGIIAMDQGSFNATSIKYELLNSAGSVIKTFTTTTNNITGEVFNYTTLSSGIVNIRVTVVFDENRTFNPSIDVLYSLSLNVKGSFRFKATIPTQAFMLIGYDGLGVNFGNNKTAFIGKEETVVRYGNNAIRITDNGLQKLDGTIWTYLFNKKVKAITSDYILEDNIDMIVINSNTVSGNINITLPSNAVTGREVYIRCYGQNANIHIKNNDGKLVNKSGRNKTTSMDTNCFSTIMIFDGINWVQIYGNN